VKESGRRSQLQLLTMTDFKRAAYILYKAFLKDPLWQYLVPNINRRQCAMIYFFKVFVKFNISNFKAFGISKPVDGVAIWSSPYQKIMTLLGLFGTDLLNLISSRMIFSFFKALNIFYKSEELHRKYASKPHYYLEAIGVLPKSQGKGLTSKLIRPFLQRADKEVVGVYVETMKVSNVGFYEHFGFKCVEKIQFTNSDLCLWALYRLPN
jgi:ribosomal protein S18 acetylase RimI-like enzyme